MKDHPITGLMGVTMDKIRELVNSDQIIGQPIQTPDGVTIIPVCKVNYGFASGGSDLPTKREAETFGGGGGAGVTIEPVAFLVIREGNVRLLQLSSASNTVDRLIDTVPDVVDKVSGMVAKSKEKKAAEETESEKTE